MISSKDQLNFFIAEDAKVNHITTGTRYWIKLFYGNVNACVFRYLKSLRKYEYYTNSGSLLRYWYRFYNRRLGLKYNLALPINKIGYGLYIPHIEGGIIINCRKMGNYCGINSGVVVGNKNTNDEVPEIGDNAKLTIGCKVIGKIRVGNNVVIAPNSVVIKDVPDNCVVSGIPATIIKKDGVKKSDIEPKKEK